MKYYNINKLGLTQPQITSIVRNNQYSMRHGRETGNFSRYLRITKTSSPSTSTIEVSVDNITWVLLSNPTNSQDDFPDIMFLFKHLKGLTSVEGTIDFVSNGVEYPNQEFLFSQWGNMTLLTGDITKHTELPIFLYFNSDMTFRLDMTNTGRANMSSTVKNGTYYLKLNYTIGDDFFSLAGTKYDPVKNKYYLELNYRTTGQNDNDWNLNKSLFFMKNIRYLDSVELSPVMFNDGVERTYNGVSTLLYVTSADGKHGFETNSLGAYFYFGEPNTNNYQISLTFSPRRSNVGVENSLSGIGNDLKYIKLYFDVSEDEDDIYNGVIINDEFLEGSNLNPHSLGDTYNKININSSGTEYPYINKAIPNIPYSTNANTIITSDGLALVIRNENSYLLADLFEDSNKEFHDIILSPGDVGMLNNYPTNNIIHHRFFVCSGKNVNTISFGNDLIAEFDNKKYYMSQSDLDEVMVDIMDDTENPYYLFENIGDTTDFIRIPARQYYKIETNIEDLTFNIYNDNINSSSVEYRFENNMLELVDISLTGEDYIAMEFYTSNDIDGKYVVVI